MFTIDVSEMFLNHIFYAYTHTHTHTHARARARARARTQLIVLY